MSIEKPPSVESLNEKRVNYAASMMSPYWLIQYIAFETRFHDKELPNSIEWSKDTDLGSGNVYINDTLLGRYFNSQEEFIESCMHPTNSSGEKLIDENQKPIQIFRDFDTETDTSQFPIDPQKYSVIKVFVDDTIALAGKTDADGSFSVDVYPSKDLKKEILESLMEIAQSSIDKDMVKIHKSLERVKNYREQLFNLN